jgi:uncharacterized membrane protein YcaP (DUF421 family)
MNIFKTIFGEGHDLDTLQMCARAVVVFVIALVLIRVSGRRSFGVKTSLDNIIAILLGAVLSRAVVGASQFVPVILCCLVIVCLHRVLSLVIIRFPGVGRLVEGKHILVFEHGHFIDQHLRMGLVAREDIMEGVRKSALTEDMSKIDKVYLERNGDVSPILKERS